VPLPFHKVIYTIEDVDAASHVVQRRGVAAAKDPSAAAGIATWLAADCANADVEIEDVPTSAAADQIKQIRFLKEGAQVSGKLSGMLQMIITALTCT
jgi:hypothetical protein